MFRCERCANIFIILHLRLQFGKIQNEDTKDKLWTEETDVLKARVTVWYFQNTAVNDNDYQKVKLLKRKLYTKLF